jgi:hypothetical protein
MICGHSRGADHQLSVLLQRIDASAKHTRRDGPNVAPVPVSVSKEKWSLLRV